MMWGHLCEKAQTKVKEMGFGPLLSIPLLKANKALLMALVERWSPLGEIGLTPTNFYMMTCLPMGCDPPPYKLVPS